MPIFETFLLTSTYQENDNVDFRHEKEFSLGKSGRLEVFLDVFNLLGSNKINIVHNPGGTWKPADANTNVGVFTQAPDMGNPLL